VPEEFAAIESYDLSADGLLDTSIRHHSGLLPATSERVANRVQLLPHFSIARLQRLREEEGCVACRSAIRDQNLGVQRDDFSVGVPNLQGPAEGPSARASEGMGLACVPLVGCRDFGEIGSESLIAPSLFGNPAKIGDRVGLQLFRGQHVRTVQMTTLATFSSTSGPRTKAPSTTP
jgi:hypothetical protein